MTKPKELQTRYRYIHFEFEEFSESGKTKIYGCYNNKTLDDLGEIRWHGPWRQYCYVLSPLHCMATLNKSCLDDIGNFIQQLMDNRTKESHPVPSK